MRGDGDSLEVDLSPDKKQPTRGMPNDAENAAWITIDSKQSKARMNKVSGEKNRRTRSKSKKWNEILQQPLTRNA